MNWLRFNPLLAFFKQFLTAAISENGSKTLASSKSLHLSENGSETLASSKTLHLPLSKDKNFSRRLSLQNEK